MSTHKRWVEIVAKGRTPEQLARLDEAVVAEAAHISEPRGGHEIVWAQDGAHSAYADVRVGALTVRLRASYWSMNPDNPGVPMWVPSVRRLPAEGDDALAGPVAMGDATSDREIVVIEGKVGAWSIEAAQAAAARLLVRAYGPAAAWTTAAASPSDDGYAEAKADAILGLALPLDLDHAEGLTKGATSPTREEQVEVVAHLFAAVRELRCLRAATRAEQSGAAPLISDDVGLLMITQLAAWGLDVDERVDLVLALLDAARALNSGSLINGPEATVAAPAYHALQAAAHRAEPAYAGDRCLRYARLVADAVNDRSPPEDRAAARARATTAHDRLLAVLAADDPRRAMVASLGRLLEEQPEGDELAEGDDRCRARVPPDLPGPHTPPGLVGARCEATGHQHGSHYASEGATWVMWKDGQLVGSSLHDEARRGGAVGG